MIQDLMRLIAEAPRFQSEPPTAGEVASAAPTKARLVRLDAVSPRKVSWLWPARIALGKVTLLAGDPGLGKSFVSLDIAARISVGRRWPDDPTERERGGVVLLGAEDDIADTVRPRLDAAGADVSRIVALSMVRQVDRSTGAPSERQFSLQGDLDALEEAIDSVPNCELVVIDPISAYLGATDSHNNAEVRGLIAPLAELAARRGVAVLAVTHLNKSNGNAGPAVYRMTGSLAFAAAARAVWLVAKDKDDPKRRLFLPVKNNIGADSLGLAFSLDDSADPSAPVVAWENGAVSLDADEALARDQQSGDGGALGEAVEWLRAELADGPMQVGEMKKRATANGISWRTVERAKKVVGITNRPTGPRQPWVWSLAKQHTSPTASALPLRAGLGGVGGLEKTTGADSAEEVDDQSPTAKAGQQ